jgi:hypothetical protein
MSGLFFVKELWLNLEVLPDYSLFHLIQIYGIYHINLILLGLGNRGMQDEMELIKELVIFRLHRREFGCCYWDDVKHRLEVIWLLVGIIFNSIGLIGGKVSHELKLVALCLS